MHNFSVFILSNFYVTISFSFSSAFNNKCKPLGVSRLIIIASTLTKMYVPRTLYPEKSVPISVRYNTFLINLDHELYQSSHSPLHIANVAMFAIQSNCRIDNRPN
jgi:hypothetical protein